MYQFSDDYNVRKGLVFFLIISLRVDPRSFWGLHLSIIVKSETVIFGSTAWSVLFDNWTAT